MPAEPEDRLVPSPVFILSTMRSGSTLLRVLLNSHSRICSPHEMHLRTLEVRFTEFYTRLAMDKLGLDGPGLEYLLWDRLLHRELGRSGKEVIVDKTPGNALCWRRLRECWPEARYVFLLRHPGSVLGSVLDTSQSQWKGMTQMMLEQFPSASGSRGTRETERPDATDMMTKMVLEHLEGVDEAMKTLPGLTVRYEELVERPVDVTRPICAFLDVPWEPQMLEYGKHDHGPFEVFIGDFTDKIRSGEIRQARALPEPDEVPAALHDVCRSWGYLE
jgi:hypothetical protein